MNHDVMPAGREMDALVAEKVMGWRLLNYETGEYATSEEDYADGANNDGWMWEGQYGDREAHQWQPSRFIADAWEVVGKFIPHFRIECNEDSDYVEGEDVKRWHCDIWVTGREVCCVSADTAPLAICRAALKAVSTIHPKGDGTC